MSPIYSYEVSHFVLRKDEKQAPFHVVNFDDFAPAMKLYKTERDKILELVKDDKVTDWLTMLIKIHYRNMTQVNDIVKYEGTF